MAAVLLAEGDANKLRRARSRGRAAERTGIEAWPVVRLAFQSTVETLDGAGPEVQEARYEGRRSNLATLSPGSSLPVGRDISHEM